MANLLPIPPEVKCTFSALANAAVVEHERRSNNRQKAMESVSENPAVTTVEEYSRRIFDLNEVKARASNIASKLSDRVATFQFLTDELFNLAEAQHLAGEQLKIECARAQEKGNDAAVTLQTLTSHAESRIGDLTRQNEALDIANTMLETQATDLKIRMEQLAAEKDKLEEQLRSARAVVLMAVPIINRNGAAGAFLTKGDVRALNGAMSTFAISSENLALGAMLLPKREKNPADKIGNMQKDVAAIAAELSAIASKMSDKIAMFKDAKNDNIESLRTQLAEDAQSFAVLLKRVANFDVNDAAQIEGALPKIAAKLRNLQTKIERADTLYKVCQNTGSIEAFTGMQGPDVTAANAMQNDRNTVRKQRNDAMMSELATMQVAHEKAEWQFQRLQFALGIYFMVNELYTDINNKFKKEHIDPIKEMLDCKHPETQVNAARKKINEMAAEYEKLGDRALSLQAEAITTIEALNASIVTNGQEIERKLSAMHFYDNAQKSAREKELLGAKEVMLKEKTAFLEDFKQLWDSVYKMLNQTYEQETNRLHYAVCTNNGVLPWDNRRNAWIGGWSDNTYKSPFDKRPAATNAAPTASEPAVSITVAASSSSSTDSALVGEKAV